jgi:dTDP-4-dehydrorhamnose 3,5-epimerase
MIFEDTRIEGVWVIRPERHEDERGWFARTWDRDAFESNGLNPRLVQCSISFSAASGTLRGLHYQAAPFEESKLVRCTSGAIYDVALDLRPDSPTFKGWVAAELTAVNRTALCVPEGCAHGFLTLETATEVHYQMTECYVPGAGRGVRWDDPAFGIEWPSAVSVIGERDRTYPDFESARKSEET